MLPVAGKRVEQVDLGHVLLKVTDPSLKGKAQEALLKISCQGNAGDVKDIFFRPEELFRVDVIQATDDSTNTGHGTKVRNFVVGCRQQFTPDKRDNGGYFSYEMENNKLKYDTCAPALTMWLTIEFLETCEFRASLFGKVVLR